MRWQAAAVLCAVPLFVRAAEWTSEATLATRAEGIRNSALTVPASEPAYRFTLSGAANLAGRAENWDTDASAGIAAYRSNDSSLENTDYTAGIGASRRFTLDTFRLRANYRRDSTLASELQTTGIVVERVQRGNANVTLAWQHAFTERFSASIEGGKAGSHYFAPQGSGLVDNTARTLAVGASYAYDERTSIGVTASELRFDTDPFTSRTRVQSAQVNVSRALNERWSVSAAYGPARTHTETASAALVCPAPIELCQAGLVPFVAVPTTAAQDANGSLYSVTAVYAATPTTGIVLQASRSANPSGVGAVVVAERYAATMTSRLTEYWTLALAATAIQSTTLVNSTESQTRWADLSGTLTWQAAERLYVDGGLRAESAVYAPGAHPYSATAFVALRYNPRLGVLR